MASMNIDEQSEHSEHGTIRQVMPFSDPRSTDSDALNVMERGDGCYVINENGQAFLEMMGGLWCAGLGFNNTAVTAAVTEQLQTLPFYHGFMGKASRPPLRLAERLVAITPETLDRTLFANSGSEAVDTAIKLVSYYQNARGLPDKKKIVARQASYHGAGVTSASLTSLDYCHHGFDLPTSRILRTGSPSYHRCAHPGETEIEFSRRRAHELDRLIQDEDPGTVGALIGEPVQGSGGAIVPPEGYWPEIRNVLARHDVLMIADEVICGFHRTGQPFGSNTYDIRPDMMTLAKQLSASFVPISAVLFSEDMYQTIAGAAHDYGIFGYGYTYSGHPVAAAAALAALDEYDRLGIGAHVQLMAPLLSAELERLQSLEAVGHVRSVGLIGGVELDDAVCRKRSRCSAIEMAAAVVKEAEARGVIFRATDGVIAICPPMIIERGQLCQMAETLHGVIRDLIG